MKNQFKKEASLHNLLIKSLKENKKEIIEKTCIESGINKEYLQQEFSDALVALKNLVKQSRLVLEDKPIFIPSYKKKSLISNIPKGRVLQILPSSTPILSCILLPIAANLSGNEVIVKHSSKANYLASFLDSFFKKNKINICFRFGSGSKFIKKLIEERNDFVFFMGSEKYGKEIELHCIQNCIEYLGEYEGNDWAIIRNGNVKQIVNKISENVLFKKGCDCDSLKGMIIDKKIYSPIISQLNDKLPFKINENPSVSDIENPPFSSSLWAKEGNSDEEILKIFNKNKHGLSASIFDTNLKKALIFARKLSVARVIINSDTLDIHPLLPWGGIKRTSRGGAEYWVKKFTNQKTIEIS